jgi:3,4-dihydroxy 2-butanone 4-phosphate synthase/GTP cyclohydrolase II
MTTPSPVAISPVEDIVADMRAGRIVILVDEEDRENEGDLVLAADHVTPGSHQLHGALWPRPDLPDAHARALRAAQAAAHGGPQRHQDGHGLHRVDRGGRRRDHRHLRRRPRPHRAGCGGANARPDDLVQPGHIFPLQAVDGGVLMRAGHTEAGCDLAAMAGCSPPP